MSEARVPQHVPEQLESERLILRCPRPEDGPVVEAAVQASLAELRPWVPFAQSEERLARYADRVQNAEQAFRERSDFQLLLLHKQTGELVGSTSVHRPNWEIGIVEIGYWADTRHTGHGYITEAVARTVQFCIEHLHANRIELRCDTRNTRSHKVAERLGFTHEATFRNHLLGPDGELIDLQIYAKVRGVEYD